MHLFVAASRDGGKARIVADLLLTSSVFLASTGAIRVQGQFAASIALESEPLASPDLALVVAKVGGIATVAVGENKSVGEGGEHGDSGSDGEKHFEVVNLVKNLKDLSKSVSCL